MAHAQLLDTKTLEIEVRRELRKSPTVWAWETARLSLYVLGRLVITPWCLVWPALTVWLIWWFEGVGVREAIELFAASPDRAYAWIYVIGAIFHSLAIVGSEPYEWEIERRVRARLLTYTTRQRNARFGTGYQGPIQPSRADERFETKAVPRIQVSAKAS